MRCKFSIKNHAILIKETADAGTIQIAKEDHVTNMVGKVSKYVSGPRLIVQCLDVLFSYKSNLSTSCTL
jgi:hypothetical protein